MSCSFSSLFFALDVPSAWNVATLTPAYGILTYLLFILFFFWLHWVFVAARGLSLVEASRGYSSLRCAGFSLQWLLLLRSRALGVQASVAVARGLSSCGSWALERRLSSCGARA